ncbi:hypothetical protein Tco_0653255 [Tanacetum coccineum]|uniref:Uncharacterized protein n=1 Tax=Tanacetum coccineum TaxID=301880 RepID=A0ABQ4X0M8_9ASTR
MLEIMVEMQDAYLMFKKNLLRVAMFRKRLGMNKELFELLLLEMLRMFNATIALRKVIMLVTVQSQEFRILKLEELSANICMMTRIQPANIEYDEGPSYDSAFISEKEFIEADLKAKCLETELQNQFIRDRDKIRALEKERDDLQLNVSEQIKHVLELQIAQTVLKRKLNANEDKYLDDVLNLEEKLKTNENVVIKMSKYVKELFMIGPKPLSYYDPKLKHGLGYKNPYMFKKAISQNPKLYDASCLHSSKVHVNVCDTEEILKDATKSQIKMENKLRDPVNTNEP